MHEPGLISRRVFNIDRGRVVVEERWNLDAPGCPVVRSPFHNPLQSGPVHVVQTEMTEAEYRERNPTLK